MFVRPVSEYRSRHTLATHLISVKDKKIKLCFISLLLATSVGGLNILSILPYHGQSHFFVFNVLLRELAKRGHNVTVISHFPEDNPPGNYHDISLAGTIKTVQEESMPVDTSYMSIFATGMFLFNSGVENCEVMMANKQVQRLVTEKQKFDVALIEQFNNDCGLGLAYKLHTPVVGITSHVLMPFHYQRFGIPQNPAYVSYHFGGTKPTIYQKIERVIYVMFFKMGYSLVTQRSNHKTLTKYFDDIPALEDLAKEMKFLLVYHNFVLTGSKLFPANVIEVGGYHVTTAKSLTGDLKTFMEEAEHGVVYISFGSVIKSVSLPKEKVQVILGAMREFPQRFIWKWEDKTLILDKKKVYTASWLPQVDILGHPKTLAFFSHAGMGGTTEAIHFGVPMIAMPILGDQPSNAAAIEESGFGVQLQYPDLTKENLVAALKRVLDPEFQANAKRLSAAWHDRPMTPLDTAVYWIEFAARHSNLTFRTAAADVSTFQYSNLDVALVFLTGVGTVFFLISFCFRSSKQTQQKLKRS